MTVLAGAWGWLDISVCLGVALALLLLGWRLGRASAGRPVAQARAWPLADAEPEAVEESDPWTAASIGATAVDRRPGVVDIFETLRPGSPGQGGHDAGCA